MPFTSDQAIVHVLTALSCITSKRYNPIWTRIWNPRLYVCWINNTIRYTNFSISESTNSPPKVPRCCPWSGPPPSVPPSWVAALRPVGKGHLPGPPPPAVGTGQRLRYRSGASLLHETGPWPVRSQESGGGKTWWPQKNALINSRIRKRRNLLRSDMNMPNIWILWNLLKSTTYREGQLSRQDRTGGLELEAKLRRKRNFVVWLGRRRMFNVCCCCCTTTETDWQIEIRVLSKSATQVGAEASSMV